MTRPPELILVGEAIATGIAPESIYRRARSRELTRIHPGAYMPTAAWSRLRPEGRLRARVAAARARLAPEAVFTHESAAVLQRIPLIGAVPTRPHVLVPPNSPRSTPAIRRTERGWTPDDVATLDGLRVTTPAITAIDIAATRTPLGAVLAICHVRNRCGIELRELESRVAERRPFRGVRQVEQALRTSSGDCASPLEALVLARCEDLGFERPEQQRTIDTGPGRFWVDFTWHNGQTVLEADGAAKYRDAEMLRGRTPAEAVIAEKRREQAIREVVERFDRTDWASAYTGEQLERTLTRLGVPRIRRPRPLRT